MISPTGKGIRVDSEGDGNYGSMRGSRIHNGVDYLADNGQPIVAPFDMIVVRVAFPKGDMIMRGIKWQKGTSTGRLFYFDPSPDLIGKFVTTGQVIGFAQNVSEYYGLKNMKNHVHFQVNK